MPQDLLQSTEWIVSYLGASPFYSFSNNSYSRPSKPCIRLPSVDEDTGHVLIHYLYTGTYQTLDNAGKTEERRVEFKRAVAAYFAARTYKLRGLEWLAMESIEHFGTQVPIADIFDVINREFQKFSDKSTWFHNYLKEKRSQGFWTKNICN